MPKMIGENITRQMGGKKPEGELPEEINVGFASGVEDEGDEQEVKRIWEKNEEMAELYRMDVELHALEVPLEKMVHSFSTMEFLLDNFPDLDHEELIVRGTDFFSSIGKHTRRQSAD
ncbi:hypothetical protein HZC53_04430 [Candidatus Uhrbacteria bacterium]|nr:hypothetical protein [Candidatus Uhrbacteria bacterium]